MSRRQMLGVGLRTLAVGGSVVLLGTACGSQPAAPAATAKPAAPAATTAPGGARGCQFTPPLLDRRLLPVHPPRLARPAATGSPAAGASPAAAAPAGAAPAAAAPASKPARLLRSSLTPESGHGGRQRHTQAGGTLRAVVQNDFVTMVADDHHRPTAMVATTR